MENLKNLIEQDLEKVNAQVEMLKSTNVIEKCNTICMFPSGLTIAPEEETNKPIIVSSIFAYQFTPETANMICEKVTNGKGESPMCVTPKEYYIIQKIRLRRILNRLAS